MSKTPSAGWTGEFPSENVNVHKYLMTETDNADYYMVATWYRTAYYQNTLARRAYPERPGERRLGALA